MRKPRIFIKPEQIKENAVFINGEDFHYLINVLRLKKDNIIYVFNGAGEDITARIAIINKDSLSAEILKKNKILSKSNISIDIAQSLPKKDKMDLIVEKCTELGARNIFPIVTQRTIPQLNEDKENKRIERWQKIAKSASIQSKRNDVLKVMSLASLASMKEKFNNYGLVLIPWEEERKVNLKQALKKQTNIKNVLIVIGPEGGFSKEEIKSLIDANVKTITLGRRILRTETVALMMTSIISYELGLLNYES